DSIMNYCSSMSRLSALDVIGARSAYGPRRSPSCQGMADKYGIGVGGGWGFAPKHVQDRWGQLNCAAVSNSNATCQKVSDAFGTDSPGNGLISDVAKTWWQVSQCTTRPLIKLPVCQRGAETWGIVQESGVILTWGSAPPEVKAQ